MTQPKRGEPFNLVVTLHTDKNCYAVLVDEIGSRYLPIIITEAHLAVLEKILALPMDERNVGLHDLGLVSSLAYLIDLLGCQVEGLVVEWSEDGKHFNCHLEIYQSNEVDTCYISLPIPLFEAPLVASVTGTAFFLYETTTKRIALLLDPEEAAGKDIKDAVVQDIMRREKSI